ncbi:tRNA (guanosine(37)-N1)-methyltransferase TrmD [Patescibacteria group bacterium]|nr:tRNA (guanosine(37)-N1)-methyltransferase TrmD [Patescibacteria group bacterium]MBU4274874.1 tRNA (guanosine(37)-N1)-methyltransferase TrmD [Patescibacteria group bacterium]MBU4367957.1 tRNA (guanosine(37)-N1)-methyltransferase TrmD [Patescibacteria group bacterium]MBU4462138.1 tRNA (guanosine(37)-N1)-methyltransferase TrmD [Patescibacteria group bacterium]MCG2699800.1 tRNA (guanosine(37)-N1)-methyltransferase TrmD [Candidatus Parcubacteria bacterium]
MKFDIITIFPKIFRGYFEESLIKKARQKGLISIDVHNLRDFTKDKHKTVDDKPFGGGLGMVMKVEPIYKAIQSLKLKNKKQRSKIILFTPRGKKFNQKLALKLSELDRIIMICGRYEGVDERVAKNIADMELSIGDYDLMGGELPAMIVVETVSRLIPGVIGKKELLEERITKSGGFLEYEQYTRPEVFLPKKSVKNWKVPKVLVSGNHKDIEEWRRKHSKVILS